MSPGHLRGVGAARTTDVRLCFVGDSFIAGVGAVDSLGWVGRVAARVMSLGVDLTAYNLGVRRETAPQVAARLPVEAPPRLRDCDVVGVVVGVGVNDTTSAGGRRRVPTAATLAALTSMLDYCDGQRWPALVIGPAPIGDAVQNRRIAGLSGAMAQLCAGSGHAFVPVVESLSVQETWRRAVARGDGAHPGADGYQVLADLVWPTFHRWLTDLVEDHEGVGMLSE